MQFPAKIWKTGKDGSYVITVPKAYVDNGQLKQDQEYKIEVTEQ